MRTGPNDRAGGWWLILGSLACLTGCFEPEEGCLDLAASNYDVGADEACGDCCRYPDMDVAVIHRWVLPDTTLTLEFNELYEDDFGQDFRISRLTYYLQGAAWIRTDGSRIEVQDSLLFTRVSLPGDTVETFLEDNLVRVDGNNFQAQSLGTFRGFGSLSDFEISLGLSPEYVTVLPSSVPSGHPLSETDLWTEEEGYAQCRLVLVSEAGPSPLTKEIVIRTPQSLGEGLIRAPSPLELAPGFSTEITLQADYRTWLKGVNTLTDSESIIADKILNNLSGSFTLVSVVTKL